MTYARNLSEVWNGMMFTLLGMAPALAEKRNTVKPTK